VTVTPVDPIGVASETTGLGADRFEKEMVE